MRRRIGLFCVFAVFAISFGTPYDSVPGNIGMVVFGFVGTFLLMDDLHAPDTPDERR